MAKENMRAVVFKGTKHIAIEDRPMPEIKEQTDIIVKVAYTALCGSELHVFRGHQATVPGFIMGHEFTGTVYQIGAEVENFQLGDLIVVPFTVSCGKCFYCENGYSSRCEKSLLFGTPGLDGGQAEFVRVPLADSTAVKAPDGIDPLKLCLMADIFPTGFFAAKNAFSGLGVDVIRKSTVVLIGCGPVGLCALANVLQYSPKNILAVDGVEDRLDQAKVMGAEPWNYLTKRKELDSRIKELTNGRGADIVIEVVGLSPALKMGFELLRPWGNISSVGVHNGEIPWSGNEAYGKNLRIQMGRCPVRSIFPEALKTLKTTQHQLNFLVENIVSLEEAVKGYDLFDAMKVQKIVFKVN